MTNIYAGLHALEAIYHMRKQGQDPPDEVRRFLKDYISGVDITKMWAQLEQRAAFTEEFQEEISAALHSLRSSHYEPGSSSRFLHDLIALVEPGEDIALAELRYGIARLPAQILDRINRLNLRG